MGVHCKIILLCCMFEIFHSIKYLISRRMRDEVNMRKYPKARDPGCRHRQNSRLPFLTPTHGKPQPGKGYWAAAPPLGCLVCDPGAWGWPGERQRGGQAQDSLGHTSKGCNSISVLSHASSPSSFRMCRSPLEEATPDRFPCYGPLSSPPISAVTSLGSRPSEALASRADGESPE